MRIVTNAPWEQILNTRGKAVNHDTMSYDEERIREESDKALEASARYHGVSKSEILARREADADFIKVNTIPMAQQQELPSEKVPREKLTKEQRVGQPAQKPVGFKAEGPKPVGAPEKPVGIKARTSEPVGTPT